MGSSSVEPEDGCRCHDAGGNLLWWTCQQDEILLESKRKKSMWLGTSSPRAGERSTTAFPHPVSPAPTPSPPRVDSPGIKTPFFDFTSSNTRDLLHAILLPKPFASTLTNNDNPRLLPAERSLSRLLLLQHHQPCRSATAVPAHSPPQLRETVNVDRGVSRCCEIRHPPVNITRLSDVAKQRRRLLHSSSIQIRKERYMQGTT